MSVFIILALVNQGFKTALDSQKKEQMSLIATLESMKSKQDLILGVDKKIKFYQDFLLSRKNLGDKSDFIFDHVNPGLSVDKGTLEEDSFTITLEGENIYLFTQLIMQYLEGDKVSEVSITSANLNPSSKEFTVELKGTFK